VGKENLHRLDEFISLFRRCYANHCLDNTTLFAGVEEMLQALNEYKLAIASNKPNVYTTSILEGLDQRSRFDLIIGPEDVKHLKPHPEMLHYAINALSGRPETSLMIGDTDNDILAAQAANVVSCAVGWGYAPRNKLRETNPDYFINSPVDLLKIVQNGKINQIRKH
jgi:phosphoglycolate phosphatase-like HAD superfamily hydrolase